MVVHTDSFIQSLGGSIDKDHYLRPLPHRPGYSVYCLKPKFSKSKQKIMAQRPQVQAFKDYTAAAKAAYHDPEQRALWDQRHQQALKKAQKRGNPFDHKTLRQEVPIRLWDYIRRELAIQFSSQSSAQTNP